ncbi:MAG TPA: S1/P1 nuclease [Caulobacteraceae bacterium]
MGPGVALAWSVQGHMAVGDVAYDLLSRSDPKAVAAIAKLERNNPDWPRFAAQLAGVSGPARDRLLFALMSRWPDDVRGTPYDHPSWHYFLRAILDPRSPSPVLAHASAAEVGALVAGQAPTAFDLALATVRDASAPASERAISLCWIFHLVGDIHQPLHTGHLVSADYPLSDDAGGREKVRLRPGGPVIGLHAFWDEAMDGPGKDWIEADKLARRLETLSPDPAPMPASASLEQAFLSWADESYRLAETDAYPGLREVGSPNPDRAPVLTPDYVARARKVSERRLALAGRRLAWVIGKAMNSPMQRLLR